MSDFDDYDEQGNNGPADLRKALEKAKRDLKAAQDRAEAAEQAAADALQKVKATSLRDLLTDAKVDPKFARLAERDGIEPTAEAVKSWIAENKDFYNFGPAKAATEQVADEEEQAEDEEVDDLDPTYRAAIEQSGRIESGSAGVGSTSLIDRIQSLKASGSLDELYKGLADLGAPING